MGGNQIYLEHERTVVAKEQVARKESHICFQALELEEERKKIENKMELAREEAKMKADLAEELYLQKVAALNQENELAKKEMQLKIDSWKDADKVVLSFLERLKELD